MSNRKIKLYAGLVCPRRSLDLKRLESYFRLNNCDIVSDPDSATDIIVITCAFINRNINESLGIINKLKNYSARLIVGGCFFDIDKDTLLSNFEGDIITTKNMQKIDELFPEFTVALNETPDANFLHDYMEVNTLLGAREENNLIEKYFVDPYSKDREMFIIRIGYGCNMRCSYCSHRNAIGPYRSKPVAECIKEFEVGYKEGYKIFKLTSMDTGFYGKDINMTLPGLLDKFIELHDDIFFVLDDINPKWLIKHEKAILEFCKKNKIINIQTPIQSASATVLRKMRRIYDPWQLIDFFNTFKRINSENIIATEIIVGFPSETDDDFKMTMDFLHKANIDFVYTYPYYENELIDSKTIFPKCSNDEIFKRIEYAISAFNKYKISYNMFLDTLDAERSRGLFILNE